MRLSERLLLVGGGEPGLPQSDGIDAQVYIVDTHDGYLAVDAGAGRGMEHIVAELRRDRVDPAAVRWLVVTHGHADHAGGAAAWRRAIPSITVLASPDVAGWIASADEEATSVDRARAAGIYPDTYRLAPCDVEPISSPSLRLGDLDVSVVPTPGHAAGHISLHATIAGASVVLSGDALFPGGRVLLQDTWDCDLLAALRSVERLAELRPDVLLAGHLAPVVEGASAHVDRALERIRRLLPPEQLG